MTIQILVLKIAVNTLSIHHMNRNQTKGIPIFFSIMLISKDRITNKYKKNK